MLQFPPFPRTMALWLSRLMSHCYPIPSTALLKGPPCTVGFNNNINVNIRYPATALNYIPDRLYLASYLNPPTDDDLFPYPEAPASPRKRGQRGPTPLAKSNRTPPCYFTVDDTLLYNAFHHDFGPLHIGHLYRFAIQFHDVLGAKRNKDRPIVFWSAADPRSELIR